MLFRSLFFRMLDLEVYLYNYGEIGHFWVPGYEYLRQLEYRIAIARDKLEYLGEEFCTEEERALVQLADFPPLNYCCYPAVPKQYIVPKEDPWKPSAVAFQVMEGLAEEARDFSLLRLLYVYKKFPAPFISLVARYGSDFASFRDRDRKSTRLNSSHRCTSRMPSSA